MYSFGCKPLFTGIESEGVKGVVIHYTANPGSTAQDNRDYFNGLQYSGQTGSKQ